MSENLCHIISERLERNEHAYGDSGCDVTYILGIENNLSFLSLLSSIYDAAIQCLWLALDVIYTSPTLPVLRLTVGGWCV